MKALEILKNQRIQYEESLDSGSLTEYGKENLENIILAIEELESLKIKYEYQWKYKYKDSDIFNGFTGYLTDDEANDLIAKTDDVLYVKDEKTERIRN